MSTDTYLDVYLDDNDKIGKGGERLGHIALMLDLRFDCFQWLEDLSKGCPILTPVVIDVIVSMMTYLAKTLRELQTDDLAWELNKLGLTESTKSIWWDWDDIIEIDYLKETLLPLAGCRWRIRVD